MVCLNFEFLFYKCVFLQILFYKYPFTLPKIIFLPFGETPSNFDTRRIFLADSGK